MTTHHPALLIIDMINNFDFSHGPILAKKAQSIAGHIKELKAQFNKQKLPVIFINDHYNLWQADFHKIIDLCRNDYSQPIFDILLPDEQDYFLIKPKHSAFYGTALQTLLHQLQVNTLILTGIAGNICVLFTANDAYMREYALLAPNDCIASVDDQDQKYALTMMENVLKAKVAPSHHEIYQHYIIYPLPPT
ncbi:cysteine hydrolase family protein [Neobacillus jeddahensis]|uniref:cysteine hydrolase family protein n=1 Tax=Neobacillus jeddahensis TaxID=1461580 RepID=UPI0005AB560A|nr:isochorismatase family cysteine hydrolase [Neobacillus jeddahensis]